MFRKQCVQDPNDPISDEDIGVRPSKLMRNTPEKAERNNVDSCLEDGQVPDRARKAFPSAIKTDEGIGQVETAQGTGVHCTCFH